MSPETILVTGAAGGTGSTARVAVAILLEQGHRVRAMVRKPDARADALRDLGAEVVVADMLDIVAVRTAMRGCAVVYFTMSVSPNYLEAAANVAVTAKSLSTIRTASRELQAGPRQSEEEPAFPRGRSRSGGTAVRLPRETEASRHLRLNNSETSRACYSQNSVLQDEFV